MDDPIGKVIESYLGEGGPGSGFHGHAGRPGQTGGSASSGGTLIPRKFRAVNLGPMGDINKFEESLFSNPTDPEFRHPMYGKFEKSRQVGGGMIAGSSGTFEKDFRSGSSVVKVVGTPSGSHISVVVTYQGGSKSPVSFTVEGETSRTLAQVMRYLSNTYGISFGEAWLTRR